MENILDQMIIMSFLRHEGFEKFLHWISQIKGKNKKKTVIVGMEPTGPYWINLGRYLRKKEIKIGTVNAMHVKKSKELDDNSQTKTDYKDAKVIAQLVKDGRFSEPNLLEGVYPFI